MFNLLKKTFWLHLKLKKWPSKNQWRQFFKAPQQILVGREKIIFFIFLILAFSSFIFLSVNFYLNNTEIKPATGGIYIEGLVGQPRFLNPIYANSDVDRDLVQLLFSGLMRYDINGQIIPDLAREYKVEEEGKVYEFYLKEKVSWQDGVPLTADDLIFTIKTIQNPDYKSPLRASWLGVEVEKISDSALRFKLKNPYFPFPETTTLKILPKHIWENIPPQNFPLAIYNLQPIGSGPYKLIELKQDKLGSIKSLTLGRNPNYFGKKPLIPKITFLFFGEEKELIEAAKKEEIKGLPPVSFWQPGPNFESYRLVLPRYFAVFFNPEKSKILAEKEIRQALNYGTKKEEILSSLSSARKNGWVEVHSPILPEVYGFNPPTKIYEFNIEKAKEILDKAKFFEDETGFRKKIIKKEPAFQFKSDLRLGSRGKEVEELQRCLAKDPEVYPQAEISGFFGSKTKEAVIRFQEKYKKEILEPYGFDKGTGLISKTSRAKLNELCFPVSEEILPLKFSLITVDQPQLIEVAKLLNQQWQKLGVQIEIKSSESSQLEKEFIKPRNYESLLFGEVLGVIPDPFPFWHSTQKKDPGLNLAFYENKKADELLEKARQSQNFEEMAENLQKFQEILIEDAPALFLYSPDYLYLVSKEIKGINLKMIVDPSKRFSQIEDWYIKTKRAWK